MCCEDGGRKRLRGHGRQSGGENDLGIACVLWVWVLLSSTHVRYAQCNSYEKRQHDILVVHAMTLVWSDGSIQYTYQRIPSTRRRDLMFSSGCHFPIQHASRTSMEHVCAWPNRGVALSINPTRRRLESLELARKAEVRQRFARNADASLLSLPNDARRAWR